VHNINNPNPTSCVNNECIYLVGPGDECSATENCWSGMTCYDGICLGSGYGESCSYSRNTCAYGYVCTGYPYRCMPALGVGKACPNALFTPCVQGSVCFQGVCTAQYSVSSNGACLSRYSLCASGLVCSPNQTCVAATTTQATCTSNSDCDTSTYKYNQCVCSIYTGKAVCSYQPLFNPCTDALATLNTCLNTNGCVYATSVSGTCSAKHCGGEFRDSISCNCDSLSLTIGGCNYNTYCNGFPLWAIIVIIVVGVIILVAAIVLVIFCVLRRKRSNYDSI